MGQAGGVLVMRNIDSAVDVGTDEEVFTAGLVLDGGIRSPYPPGLSSAPWSTSSATRTPWCRRRSWPPAANLDSFEYALVITDYDGRPAAGRPAAGPVRRDGTVPDGEVPCYTPDPTVRPTPHPSPKASPKR